MKVDFSLSIIFDALNSKLMFLTSTSSFSRKYARSSFSYLMQLVSVMQELFLLHVFECFL